MENSNLNQAAILFLDAARQSYRLLDDPWSVGTSDVCEQLKDIRCKFDASQSLTEGSVPSNFESLSRELNSLHHQLLALYANVELLQDDDELQLAANKWTALLNYRRELENRVSQHILRVLAQCSRNCDAQIEAERYYRRYPSLP